jgi:hypothetical protein
LNGKIDGKYVGNPWKSSINGGFMAAWENPWENHGKIREHPLEMKVYSWEE